jgi:hypothetical protein
MVAGSAMDVSLDVGIVKMDAVVAGGIDPGALDHGARLNQHAIHVEAYGAEGLVSHGGFLIVGQGEAFDVMA